jgi:hypothetical protein
MKYFYGIYLIALLCTLPRIYAFQSCRYVSPGEKYYHEIRVELTQKMGEKLRDRLMDTVKSVNTYHKHHKQAQGFGFLPKIKHACTPSHDYTVQLHAFLQPKNALKHRVHNKTPGWTKTYDKAKIASLIPFIIHTKIQQLDSENYGKTISMLLKAFAIFDLTADELQTKLKNKKAELFKNIGDDEDRKRDQFAKNKLSAVSKLLSSAQAHSKQAQEALNAVEAGRATHETRVGYALLTGLLAGGFYIIYNAMAHYQNNQLLTAQYIRGNSTACSTLMCAENLPQVTPCATELLREASQATDAKRLPHTAHAIEQLKEVGVRFRKEITKRLQNERQE